MKKKDEAMSSPDEQNIRVIVKKSHESGDVTWQVTASCDYVNHSVVFDARIVTVVDGEKYVASVTTDQFTLSSFNLRRTLRDVRHDILVDKSLGNSVYVADDQGRDTFVSFSRRTNNSRLFTVGQEKYASVDIPVTSEDMLHIVDVLDDIVHSSSTVVLP